VKRMTVPRFKRLKGKRKLVMVTVYDYTFAKLIEACQCIDAVLVGDSLGNVIQGLDTTLPVEVEHIAYHTKAVSRALGTPLIVADMPFMSYYNKDTAAKTAEVLMKSGAHAVKLEGGIEKADIVKFLTQQGIPVMGHIGMTPQSVNMLGGYKIQGKRPELAEYLIESAKALQEAGAFSIVIETTKKEVAKAITEAISIPTIGIGAGKHTDGQVLVLYDMLGMDPDINFTFLKKYANLADTITNALQTYSKEVREEIFPDDEHSF